MRFFPTLGEGALAGWPMVRTADSTLRPFRRNLRRRFSQSCAVPSFRLSTTFCPGTPCGVLSCMFKQPFKWRYSDHAFNCYYSRFSISLSGRWRPAVLLYAFKSLIVVLTLGHLPLSHPYSFVLSRGQSSGQCSSSANTCRLQVSLLTLRWQHSPSCQL